MENVSNLEMQLPIKPEIIFTNNKNESNSRIEKRQTKLLSKLDYLKSFFNANEEIWLVTVGASPLTFIDYFLSGAAIIYLKRCMLVFTNQRIIHIPTKYNLAYKDSLAQILYEDCTSISFKTGKLIVKYKDGKSEKFVGLAMRERKKIKSILPMLKFENGMGKHRMRVHLCPSCNSVLQENVFRCLSCQLEFKNKSEGKRLSIIFPGGGYFYTRHPLLGIGDAITEVILLILVAMALFGVITGEEGALIAFIFFGIFLAIEKVVSVYHSNHFLNEFIPKDKTFTSNLHNTGIK